MDKNYLVALSSVHAVENSGDLLELLEQSVQKSKAALDEADEDDLLPDWTMHNGDQVLMVMPKHKVIRHSLSLFTHHRAQLGVYLHLSFVVELITAPTTGKMLRPCSGSRGMPAYQRTSFFICTK